MKRLYKNLALAVVLLSLSTYCGNDGGTSDPTLSVPDLRPTVQAALSSMLISGGSFAQALEAEPAANTSAVQAEVSTCSTNCSTDPNATQQYRLACELRNRMFCTSTFEILDLINQVDSQLAEIERRSTGVVDCMSAALTDSTSEITSLAHRHLPTSCSVKRLIQPLPEPGGKTRPKVPGICVVPAVKWPTLRLLKMKMR